jgi:ADP-ribose pyrophosphatase YjhB (NUDIX family)
MHYIQTFILDKLIHSQVLRNRDMRPPNVESNLYQYHLSQLQKDGFVEKTEAGYTLTGRGLAYADRHSTSLKKTRSQPKIITTIFVTNDQKEILLVPKKRQPFMGVMNLPSGKIHLEETIEEAAKREIQEKVSLDTLVTSLKHFGTAHMTIKQDDFVISDYISLMLTCDIKGRSQDKGIFVKISEIDSIQLVPSVKELIKAYVNRSVFAENIIEL